MSLTGNFTLWVVCNISYGQGQIIFRLIQLLYIIHTYIQLFLRLFDLESVILHDYSICEKHENQHPQSMAQRNKIYQALATQTRLVFDQLIVGFSLFMGFVAKTKNKEYCCSLMTF